MRLFKRCTIIVIAIVTLLSSSCGMKKTSEEKVRDIEFTVVNDEDIPETLKNAIEEKKKNAFKLSYADNNDLYLVAGYGEQPTGGYSIVVDELYATDNTIVFATTLKGPQEEQSIQNFMTYPYIVVKMEYLDYEVIYK